MQAPPDWLLAEPAHQPPSRPHIPASLLDPDTQRPAEVNVVLTDLRSMLAELATTHPPALDAAFHETWLNVLVVQVRWLLSLLNEE